MCEDGNMEKYPKRQNLQVFVWKAVRFNHSAYELASNPQPLFKHLLDVLIRSAVKAPELSWRSVSISPAPPGHNPERPHPLTLPLPKGLRRWSRAIDPMRWQFTRGSADAVQRSKQSGSSEIECGRSVARSYEGQRGPVHSVTPAGQ